tara:strand:+ start:37863 stop:38228 length:366 start_codon:yes stop_codon:yes gene_type:complete
MMAQGEWADKYMFNCRLISEYTIGSTVNWKGSFGGHEQFLTGTLLEIDPLKTFKYALIDPSLFDAGDPTNFVIITYEIREQGDKLLLTVLHETNDGDEDRMQDIIGGWEGFIFPATEGLLQ